MMEMKTKLRCRVVRRKCNQISKTNSKIAKRESLRKVSTILRKNESCRSVEEKAVLAKMTKEVQEVKYRLCRQQKIIERNKEVEDDLSVLEAKCKKLASALQRAKHLVVYTGAGISTAADIPDYRGPNGIWTLLQQGKKIGKHDLTKADPTSTHMALWQLYRKKYLKFVVSQNCDGLHLRSGLPKRALSEVHGNMYIELCKECKPNIQYWRLFDATERTARFYHKTGRICHKCGNPLVDSIVHFGERGIAQWPLNWAGALHHAAKADVILCLGSSLKVLKKYSWLWAMDRPAKNRPSIFIVNLQWTPKDHVAELKINGKCDTVMKLVMNYIGLEIPTYYREKDPIFFHSSLLLEKEYHTTTQPMLVKLSKSNDEFDKNDEKSSEMTEQPKDASVMEIDEDEDNCPLIVLKDKISNNPEPFSTIAEDLTVRKVKTEINEEMTEFFDLLAIKGGIKKEVNVENNNCLQPMLKGSLQNDLEQVDDNNSASLRLNYSVDVENKTSVVSTSESKDCLNNLKINAVINHSQNEVNCGSSNISQKPLDGISMEILAEEFERVHVEMKTNENEIHKVSILLVNKTKTPPKKCDKFQQTDPEPLCMDYSQYIGNVKEPPPPNINHLDTGQSLSIPSDSKKPEVENNVHIHKHVNIETKSLLSHIYIKAHHISAQVSGNISSVIDSHNILNLSSEIQTLNVSKPANPLRSFRRLKEGNKCIVKHENGMENNGIIKTEVVDLANFVSSNNDGPIDYSLKTVKSDVEAKVATIPKIYPENKYNLSYILKIPKPPILHYKNNWNHKCKNVDNKGIIDLSVRKSGNNSNYNNFRKPVCRSNNNNINRTINARFDDLDNFQRYCEVLASVIIQHTMRTNHGELQEAYSGLHSIINPVPFNVQYDFKTVFNALNFINLGKRLMSKDLENIAVRRSSRKCARNISSQSSSCSNSSAKIRKGYRERNGCSKKSEPKCSFCFENYKSSMCNFYAPQNTQDRFVRFENKKPYLCICCGDSESSESESDDNVTLMERKKRLQSKKVEENEEKKLSDDNRSNNDLNDCVQNIDKDDIVQAGWFGKGFRKNRRRKR